MRESEFMRLMAGEFGQARGRMIASSHVFGVLGERTADEALAAGVPGERVWEAVCDAFDVPPQRRLGEDRPIVDHPVD